MNSLFNWLGQADRVRTIAAELFKIATSLETVCVIEKAKSYMQI